MNTNMRMIALIFLLIAPNFVAASIWDEKAKLTDFGKINIAILDAASDGCWTNISEVRKYIKDKLEVIGVTVTDNRNNKFSWLDEGKATVRLKVHAKRIQSVCIGNYSITVSGVERNEETGNMGILNFSDFGGMIWHSDKLNIQLLDVAGDAIREWEDQF